MLKKWWQETKRKGGFVAHVTRHWYVCLVGALVLLYGGQRLTRLESIPVFADEAIYIYWSQLALSDWPVYRFFSLNDGKTPLMIWAMMPLVKFMADPLIAGRTTAIIFGLAQLLVTIGTVRCFTRKKRYQLLAGLFVIASPGLMLTNRLALMDTAVTFFISLTFILTYQATKHFLTRNRKNHTWLWWTLAAGLAWGLAMWTKFSCLLVAPVLATVPFYHLDYQKIKRGKWGQTFWWPLGLQLIPLGIVSVLAVLIFAILRISPAFGTLFSRGGDFLYSLSDFWTDPFGISTHNFADFIRVIANYSGYTLLISTVIMSILHLFWRRPRSSKPFLLLVSGLVYALPIIALGKVVYPRYYLPVIPFVIASFTVCLSLIRSREFLNFKLAMIMLIIAAGHYWSWKIHTNPVGLPLLPTDEYQLFADWPAGYGVKETAAYIEELAAKGKVLVLSEGFVGTLPDGLQIYLWKSPVRDNFTILGLGAPPIQDFEKISPMPDWDEYDQVILVGNSHRLELGGVITPQALVQEYSRPVAGAPTLQVWSLR